MTQELKDQLAAAQAHNAALQASTDQATAAAAAAQAQLAQFAEAERNARTASFVSFADAQIKTGALLPREKDAAVAVLGTLAEAKAVSFAQAGGVRTVSAVDWLKDLIARAKPAVNFGEHAAGTLATTGSAAGLSDAEIDAEAKNYARQHKVSYAEALCAVVGFTS